MVSDEVNTAIILVAIITVTTAPILFNRLYPRSEVPAPRPIPVIGAGEFGLQLADHMRAHGELVVVMDSESEKIAQADKLSFEAISGLVAPSEAPLTPYLDNAKTLVCAHSSPISASHS